jgi:hypothetical protein
MRIGATVVATTTGQQNGADPYILAWIIQTPKQRVVRQDAAKSFTIPMVKRSSLAV